MFPACHLLTSAQSVLHMCNTQQRREGSEKAHFLGTSIISFGKKTMCLILLPDQESELLDLLARGDILLDQSKRAILTVE